MEWRQHEIAVGIAFAPAFGIAFVWICGCICRRGCIAVQLHLRLHLDAFGFQRASRGAAGNVSLSLSLSLSRCLSRSLSRSLLFFFRAVVFLFVGMHSICCVVFEHSEHMSSNKIGVCMLDVFLDDVQMDQCVLCFASLKVLCFLFCKFLRGK